MSRLTQGPILDGDTIDAASLNDRFTQYSQTGALNSFNTRDQAFDLPQFESGTDRFLVGGMAGGGTAAIGYPDFKHSAYNTYTGQTTGASPYVVQDSTPADTVLSLGASGFTLGADDILRVYWDLSVRPRWTGSRPWLGGALFFTFPHGSGGGSTVNVFSGYGCWAFWLQWDVTSNALANFVNVPGQGDFNTVVTGVRGGNALSNCKSTSVLQNVVEYAAAADEGEVVSPSDTAVGWSSVDGAWHYAQGTGSQTVYGLRVVFSGPFGAYNAAGVNYLLRNDSVAASAELDVQDGSLQAMFMRVK